MRRVTLAFAGWLAVTVGAAAQGADAGSVEAFSWMAGHWRAESDGGVSEEGWFGPAGGLMVGVNRSVSADGEAAFEFLRIEAGEGGGPAVYIAQPGGGAPTRFTLVEAGERSAAFANPEHDFPQLIRYARVGDTLTATISDMDGAGALSWRWELAP